VAAAHDCQVSDQAPLFGSGSTTDLVAFEVEGSGVYLVPLAWLAGFEVGDSMRTTSFAPLGWGWSLPVVRWNTFHMSQIDIEISLAPNVTARIEARHFAGTTAGRTATPHPIRPGITGTDRQGSTPP